MIDLESLFQLSYGMYIVSSVSGDKFNGCIVNTIFQIVPEPPMVAASVNRGCLTHEYITKSGVFAVSVLSEQSPMPFIGRFGFRTGRDIDKFEGVNYKSGQTGSPIVLENTAAFLEVQVTEHIDIVTHTLFIGKVIACGVPDPKAVPMTYSYYRDVKHGRTPKSAATYIEIKTKEGA